MTRKVEKLVRLKIFQRWAFAFWGRCLRVKLGMRSTLRALQFFKDLVMVKIWVEVKKIGVSEEK